MGRSRLAWVGSTVAPWGIALGFLVSITAQAGEEVGLDPQSLRISAFVPASGFGQADHRSEPDARVARRPRGDLRRDRPQSRGQTGPVGVPGDRSQRQGRSVHHLPPQFSGQARAAAGAVRTRLGRGLARRFAQPGSGRRRRSFGAVRRCCRSATARRRGAARLRPQFVDADPQRRQAPDRRAEAGAAEGGGDAAATPQTPPRRRR